MNLRSGLSGNRRKLSIRRIRPAPVMIPLVMFLTTGTVFSLFLAIMADSAIFDMYVPLRTLLAAFSLQPVA